MWGFIGIILVFAFITTPMVMTFTKKREGESDICHRNRIAHIVGCILAIPVALMLLIALIIFLHFLTT